MKKLLSLFLLILLMIPAAYAGEVRQIPVSAEQPFAEDEALMKVYFFKVRAQDSFLIVCGGETMLIDAGVKSSGPVVAEYLRTLGIERIDYAVNTHPHDDHIDGFVPLMDEIEIGKFFVCFPHDENTHMINALAAAERHGIEVIDIDENTDLSFGGCTIRLYQDKQTDNVNGQSLVMHVSFGGCSAVFTADIGRAVHERLTAAWGDSLKCDIFKLPHHGLYNPKKIMVTTADPEVCIMTNGNNKDTGDAVRMVNSWKYPVLHTTHGNIECVTNGEYWTLKHYKTK